MTDVGIGRPAMRVPRRPSRLAVLTLVLLLAGNGVVWSLNVHVWATQVRYGGPAHEEIDALREAVAADSGNPGTLLALAYAYQQAGRYDDALDTYDAVLEIVPTETAALYNRAVILLELGESAGAESSLRAALDVNAGHALAAGLLGTQLLERRDFESVLEVVLPATESSPGAAELHYIAGSAYESLGETASAVESYRRALQSYPDQREARKGLERLEVEP